MSGTLLGQTYLKPGPLPSKAAILESTDCVVSNTSVTRNGVRVLTGAINCWGLAHYTNLGSWGERGGGGGTVDLCRIYPWLC